MNRRTKYIVLLCLSLVLIALLLLSASLSNLHLQQGAPIPGAAEPNSSLGNITPIRATPHDLFPLPGMIVGGVLIAFLVYTLARLAGLVDARRILWLVLGVVLLIGLANILPRVVPGPAAAAGEDAPPAASPPSREYLTSPLGDAPSLFGWLAAGCILLGTGAFAVLLLKRPPRALRAREALARSAEDALRELAAGKDFSSVIVECYLRMSDVVRAERDIQRSRQMTAREFQEALEQHGLPAGPVHGLTLLFERARYGAEQMSQVDVNASQEYLRQVVQHCRAVGGGEA